MPKAKILVVDDEIDVTKVVEARLKKANFDVSTAKDGKEALTSAKKTLPDLILLDIMMPGMDGYEVAERLRKDSKTSLVPIIMLTAKASTEDKIKALKKGIEDYITKPYDANELIARVEAVLRRTKKGPLRTAVPLSVDERKRIELLEKMINEKIMKLVPEYNMVSPNGYGWPYAAEFFGIKDGSEINHINFITEKGCFDREFFDKVLLCPHCGHHDINVRETCPSNHSTNISVAEMIHHFRCGYVGTEAEFRQGIRYVCPKCGAELRQVGIDYDKPGQSYICHDTKEKFTEPDVYCQCRNCKKQFAVDDAVRQDIFTYVLNERGKQTAEVGRFSEVNLETAIVDEDVDLYNLRYFKKQFSDEIERAKKFKRAFSLMAVSIPDFDKLVNEIGITRLRTILKDIASILKESIWEVDTPARYDKNAFITLLPEADKGKATVLAGSLNKKIAGLTKENLRIRISVASYPEDADTEDGLIEKLLR
ncbi:MAG: response regulator [Candidatus Omnitrophota bacterium]